MEPTRDDLVKALSQVIDPELRRPVTELDMVRAVDVAGGDVRVTIALTVAGCPLRSSFEDQVQRAVGAVPGVERVSLSFDVVTPDARQALTTKLRGGVTERTRGSSLDAATRVLARSGSSYRARRPWSSRPRSRSRRRWPPARR